MFHIGDKIVTKNEIHHGTDTRIPSNSIGILSNIINKREIVIDFPFVSGAKEISCDVSNVTLLWTP